MNLSAGFLLLLTILPTLEAYVSVSPETLSFTYQQGNQSPPAVNVTITGASRFTIQVTTNPAGWLDVSPPSGNGPAVLQVRLLPSGLAVADYRGLITITDPTLDPRYSSPVTVNVYLSVRAGIPSTSQQSPARYFAHFAEGGGWSTHTLLVNNTGTTLKPIVRFRDDAGYPVRLPIVQEGPSAWWDNVMCTLEPYSTCLIKTADETGRTVGGWMYLEDPSQGGVGAVASFRQRIEGKPDYEAAIPLTAAYRRQVLPFFNYGGFITGVALANPGVQRVSVLARVRGWTGRILIEKTLAIEANGHIAFAMSNEFPLSQGWEGTVEFVAQSPASAQIVALALRFNPTGPLTTLQPAYSGN